MMESDYYEKDDNYEGDHSLVNFNSLLTSIKDTLLTYLPPLPLYFPTTETYLSEIPMKNNRKLFISDAHSCSDKNLLNLHNITGIVSIRTTYALLSPVYKKIDELECKEGIDVLKLYMNDKPTISLIDHINPIIHFIDQCLDEKRQVLIHCTAGKSRSVAFTILYLMIKEKQTFYQAFDLVKNIRPEILMNSGFIEQLLSINHLLSARVE